MGAGTFHPATVLWPLGINSMRIVFFQPSRRPKDGRYGKGFNRLQNHCQLQVFLKPSPEDVQDLYLKSLEDLGIDLSFHEIKFVEDDWESPTIGAFGFGWEVQCNGMEITQFTYFQKIGGLECSPVSVEITYGLERLTIQAIQERKSVYDMKLGLSCLLQEEAYLNILRRVELEFSIYNFEYANTNMLTRQFIDMENECKAILNLGLVFPAYDYCIKANHIFNILDARGVIGIFERANYIGRIRSMVSSCCELYVKILSKSKNGKNKK